MKRSDQREKNQLRTLEVKRDAAPNALASLEMRCGNTRVLCAVTCEESVPRWMQSQGVKGGWLTAEYSMLPYATLDRKPRDITKGKLDGRSQEIQRLIGRSLRAIVDLELLGNRTLWVDCDVLAADGGTRTTSITGAYMALRLACERLLQKGLIVQSPIKAAVAATSVGVVDGEILLDLCYTEDRDAAVDLNLVMTNQGDFVEIQGSGEESTFSRQELQTMLDLGEQGMRQLFEFQSLKLKEKQVVC